MPVNFDAAIPFSGNTVVAIGPEHPIEKIKHICVWIFQSGEGDAGNAAATETTYQYPPSGPKFLRVDGATSTSAGRWMLPVTKLSTESFREGRAFAIAVALVVEDLPDGTKKETVGWWNQQIELHEDPDRVQAAENALILAANLNTRGEASKVLKSGGDLAEALEFKGLR